MKSFYPLPFFRLSHRFIPSNWKSQSFLRLYSNSNSIESLKGSQKDQVLYGVIWIETYFNSKKELKIRSLGVQWEIRNQNQKQIKNQICNLQTHPETFLPFWNEIIKTIPSSRSLYLYTHHLKEFEGYLLFSYFYQWNCKNSQLLWNKNKEILEIRFENLILRDSYQILPESLSNLAFWVLKKSWDFNSFLFHENQEVQETWKEQEKRIQINLFNYYSILIYYQQFFLLNYKLPLWRIYTTPNMAFQIYRINFQSQSIPNLKLPIYNQLKSSYSSGYFYWLKEYGQNLYHYDVNSLYPYVMLNSLPGTYLGFQSSISLNEFLDQDLFGFFNCTISIPKSNSIRLLPFHQNWKNLNSNSEFEGLFFSEEIKNFIKLNYQIQIHSGFIFTRLNGVFQDYIDHFYQIKMNPLQKDIQFLAKTILNSLTGYLGRYPLKTYQKIISEKEVQDYLQFFEILDLTDLHTGNYSIRYRPIFNLNLKDEDYFNPIILSHFNSFQNLSSNIAIASAITSYGRIFMTSFLKKDWNLYYCDCDSLIVDQPLDSSWIGSNLGQFKLIHEIQEGYFLGPKFYGYKTKSNEIVIKSAGLPNHLIDYSDFQKIHQGENLKFSYSYLLKNDPDFKLTWFQTEFSFKK